MSASARSDANAASTSSSDLLHAALQYARASFPVFPIYEIGADGHCACGKPDDAPNHSPGKHPRTAHGFLDATTDETTIRGWWTEWPDANVGIATGHKLPNGGYLHVVDVDPRNGGDESFAKLQDVVDVPETREVATGGDGAHFYFASTAPLDSTKLKAYPGLDFKGAGGYVLAPPSNHVSGGTYGLAVDATIARLPDALLGLLLQETLAKGDGFAVDAVPVEDGDGRIEKAESYLRTAPLSIEGQRGRDVFFGVAVTLTRLMQLPVKVAAACVERVYNPRLVEVGTTEWRGEELYGRLESARTTSSVAPGLVLSATTNRGIDAVSDRVTTPAALRKTTSEPAPRKQHNPAHEYGFAVGRMAASPNAQKVAFNSLIDVFANGDDWAGCWQYDEFAECVRCVDPPIRLDAETKGLSETDLSTIRAWLEHMGVLATAKDIADAVKQAAIANTFHPVRDYFAALPSGDPSIFNGLAKKLFGTSDAMADSFMRMTMVAAVRRILTPGCQVDTVLVLVGEEQGEKKTTSVEALFGREWTRRGLPTSKGLNDRDAAHALRGRWAVELGELVSLTKSTNEESKDFITKPEDRYRDYGTGLEVHRLRQCVFVGTTNDQRFLRDYANRRYWPIQVPKGHKIPIDWIRGHRDELWAAALLLAKDSTFRHWFDDEAPLEQYRQTFLELDPWHDAIETYCAGREFVRPEDVFLAMPLSLRGNGPFDRAARGRILDTLKKLGCREGKADNGRTRVMRVPVALATATKGATKDERHAATAN